MEFRIPTFSFLASGASKGLRVKPRVEMGLRNWKSWTLLFFLGLSILSFLISVTFIQLNIYKFETATSDVQNIKKFLQSCLILIHYSIIFVIAGYFIDVQTTWRKFGFVLFVIGITFFVFGSFGIAITTGIGQKTPGIGGEQLNGYEINDDQKSILALTGSMMIISYISMAIVALTYHFGFTNLNKKNKLIV